MAATRSLAAAVEAIRDNEDEVAMLNGRAFAPQTLLEGFEDALRQNFMLRFLSLAHCRLRDDGCRRVVAALRRHPNLQSLNLSHNDISDAGVQNYLCPFVHTFTGLVHLNLAYNGIEDGAGSLLATAILGSARYVRHANPQVSLTDQEAIAGIRVLNLSGNAMTDVGIQALFRAARTGQTPLQILHVRWNRLSDTHFCLRMVERQNQQYFRFLHATPPLLQGAMYDSMQRIRDRVWQLFRPEFLTNGEPAMTIRERQERQLLHQQLQLHPLDQVQELELETPDQVMLWEQFFQAMTRNYANRIWYTDSSEFYRCEDEAAIHYSEATRPSLALRILPHHAVADENRRRRILRDFHNHSSLLAPLEEGTARHNHIPPVRLCVRSRHGGNIYVLQDVPRGSPLCGAVLSPRTCSRCPHNVKRPCSPCDQPVGYRRGDGDTDGQPVTEMDGAQRWQIAQNLAQLLRDLHTPPPTNQYGQVGLVPHSHGNFKSSHWWYSANGGDSLLYLVDFADMGVAAATPPDANDNNNNIDAAFARGRQQDAIAYAMILGELACGVQIHDTPGGGVPLENFRDWLQRQLNRLQRGEAVEGSATIWGPNHRAPQQRLLELAAHCCRATTTRPVDFGAIFQSLHNDNISGRDF